MASSSVLELAPAARQSNFEQGVAIALHSWPALTLAVQNEWGGTDSRDKRDWFAGAVVDLFPPFADPEPKPRPSVPGRNDSRKDEPDVEDVETLLLQVMMDEFEVNVDDDSAFELAKTIVALRDECAKGQVATFERLQDKWRSRKDAKVDGLFKRAEDADQDTDWDSDDSDDSENGDEDVEMGEAPALVRAPKEKPAPEVDDDGFTKVTKKKR